LLNSINEVWSYLDHRLWKPLNRRKNETGLFPITSCSLSLPRPSGAYISHKHKVVYYTIPKAACTTIKLFIGLIEGTATWKDNPHELSMLRLSLPEARSILYKDYFHFTFVRNPYDRLLSCYMDKIYEVGLCDHDDREFANGEFRQFLVEYGRLGYREMSFADFIWFVTRVPDRHCDRHFIPQHYLLNLDLLNFVGHFENLNQDFLYVRKQIGLSDDTLQLQKINASKHGPYQNYYNDKLRKMVARKYARDLEIFNYDF